MYYLHILQEQVRYRFLRAFDVVRRRDGNSDDGASVAVKREDDVTTVSHTARVLLEGEIYGSSLQWKILNFDVGVLRFSSLGPGLDELSGEIGYSDYKAIAPRFGY